MFSEDRRPLLNIRDQMKKVSKIEKKEFLKEFKDKMKRLKVTRHKQLIHLAGGKQQNQTLPGLTPELDQPEGKEPLTQEQIAEAQKKVRETLAKELLEKIQIANDNDNDSDGSSSSELTDQASSHLSAITNSEKRWEAIEKKVKEKEEAYKSKELDKKKEKYEK